MGSSEKLGTGLLVESQVSKYTLSYTRNGYTWIDLPTVYEEGELFHSFASCEGNYDRILGGIEDAMEPWKPASLEDHACGERRPAQSVPGDEA